MAFNHYETRLAARFHRMHVADIHELLEPHDVSYNTLAAMAQGTRPRRLMKVHKRLAAALGLTLDELLAEIDTEA